MLFAVIVSATAALAAMSGVLFLQFLAAQNKAAMIGHHRTVAELAKQTGGVLTPPVVAEHFSISYVEADRLLRSMVDGRYFRMKVDDRKAELIFWFTELVEEPNAPQVVRAKDHTPRPKPRPRVSTSG